MSESMEKLKLAEKLVGRGKVRAASSSSWRSPPASRDDRPNDVRQGRARRTQKGRHFRMGMGHGATTDSLDPATYPDQMTGTIGWGAMGNSLTEMDAKGEVVPDLAESFEPGDDAKSWVFKIRKGVTFHNGKNVTADDVIASYRHHMGPDSKSAAKSMLTPSPTSRPTATT